MRGVVRDLTQAAFWYRQSARQGEAGAQFNLGVLYANGQGVLQDHTRAYMWFNIAAVSGDADSIKNREVVSSKMTPQQIEQAQRTARECLSSNYKNCN
jgi:TPR repeat protein